MSPELELKPGGADTRLSHVRHQVTRLGYHCGHSGSPGPLCLLGRLWAIRDMCMQVGSVAPNRHRQGPALLQSQRVLELLKC